MLGKYELSDGILIFKGGVTNWEGQQGYEVGNFICDQTFGGGTIEAKIKFSDNASNSSVGIILYYHPTSASFVTVQMGGISLCSVRTFTGREWNDHAAHGPISQIEPNRHYHLMVEVIGSKVKVKLDGIEVIETNLNYILPKGQAGIIAAGPNDISISNFNVAPKLPNLFVVMQYTDQFSELYNDVILPQGKKSGFEVMRADETYGPGIIITDIEQQIIEAKAVIADITPNNPNVYWEVGYAYALRKPTILIAQRDTELPFDISPFRTLFYNNTIAGKSKIEEGLCKHLEAIQGYWSR